MDLNKMKLSEIRELKDILAKELVDANRALAELFEKSMGIKFDAVIEIKPMGASEKAKGRYEVSTIVHFDGEDL